MTQQKGMKVVGARGPVYWVLIVIVLVVVGALAVGGLVIYPQMQEKKGEQARLAEAERHYQAGVAFETAKEWEAARAEYMQVIAIDARYRDVQARLAEVQAQLAERSTAATAIAQATDASAPTATAETLEARYQKALAYIDREQWNEAKAELEQVFDTDPNYKEVQAKLTEVEARLARSGVPTETVSVGIASIATSTQIWPSGSISFSADQDPDTLNLILRWDPGGAAGNSYDLTLNPGALTLIAGPESWRDGLPVIYYPIEGNFVAQVRITLNSSKDKIPGNAHMAYLALRSAQVQKPEGNWFMAGRGITDKGHVVWSGVSYGSCSAGHISYVNPTVYVRIARRGSLLSSWYSFDGRDWITMIENCVHGTNDKAEIMLGAHSTNEEGVIVIFDDFVVTGQSG